MTSELSIKPIKRIILWVLGSFAALLFAQIFSKPLSLAVDWFGQFIPSFIGNIYVFFLSQLLFPYFHNSVLLTLVLILIIFAFYLSKLASIIKTWRDIKRTQNIADFVEIDSQNELKQKLSTLTSTIQTPLIQLSLLTMSSFIVVIWFSSFFMWQNIFESNIIILSSRYSYNEVNSYRMKWLTMRTKEEFFELMNTMNKDVKNVQIELKKT
jgi:hypothetical protein